MVGTHGRACHRARPDVGLAAGANAEAIGANARDPDAASHKNGRTAGDDAGEPATHYFRMGRSPTGTAAGAEDQPITGLAAAFAARSARRRRRLYARSAGAIAEAIEQIGHDPAIE